MTILGGHATRLIRLVRAAPRFVLGAGLVLHPAPPSRAVVIRNVNVVDVERGTIAPKQVIVLDGGRIAAVGPAPRIPPNARVIDAHGGYAIPGLWDMHVHFVDPRDTLPPDPQVISNLLTYMRALSFANGIVGVRDMASDLALLRTQNAAAEGRGALVPRSVVTGQKLGLSRPVVPGAPYPIRTADDVLKSEQMLIAAGANHIKLQGLQAARLRDALNDCRTLHVPCVGHISDVVSLTEMSDLGLKSGEHLFLLPQYTSSREADVFRWMSEQQAPRLIDRVLWKLGLRERPPIVADVVVSTHDSAKAMRIFRGLAKNGTYMTPTLVLSQAMIRADPADSMTQHDEFLLRPRPATFLHESRTPDEQARARRLQQLNLHLVREMRDAGVQLLAGTDVPTLNIPGFALHRELAELVRAGLTPLEALRAATLTPARYLNATDSLGTVAPGKVADLDILDGNPLANIDATQSLRLVVTRGRVLERAQLDSLLNVARQAAAALRTDFGPTPSGR